MCKIFGHKWVYKNDWLHARYGEMSNASWRMCARCHKNEHKVTQIISIDYWETIKNLA